MRRVSAPGDRELLMARYKDTTMVIRSQGGREVAVKPGCGGLHGWADRRRTYPALRPIPVGASAPAIVTPLIIKMMDAMVDGY